MTPDNRPHVQRMADTVDKHVARCDCGCGLLVECATHQDAQDIADQALEAHDGQ